MITFPRRLVLFYLFSLKLHLSFALHKKLQGCDAHTLQENVCKAVYSLNASKCLHKSSFLMLSFHVNVLFVGT